MYYTHEELPYPGGEYTGNMFRDLPIADGYAVNGVLPTYTGTPSVEFK